MKNCSSVTASGFPTLQPHLTGAVVGVHRGLDSANPVDSHVRGNFDCWAIHGDAEIDDVRILVAAQRLRLQASSGDVGDGVAGSGAREAAYSAARLARA